MKYVVIFLIVFLSACTRHAYAPFTPSTQTVCKAPAKFRTTYFADPSFDELERNQLRRASDEWFALSDGRIEMTVTFASGVHRIHKVQSTGDIVKTQDSMQSERHKSSFTSFGWTASNGDIYLVVDRVKLNELHSLLVHEMGHAAHLKWPGCDNSKFDCIHSPDQAAIMYPVFGGDRDLSPSDLAFCRANCLCP